MAKILILGISMLFYLVLPDTRELQRSDSQATIRRHCNRDLTEISAREAESLTLAFQVLGLAEPHNYGFRILREGYGHKTRFLCEFQKRAEPSCYVLVGSEDFATVPGSTNLRLKAMSARSKHPIDLKFTTGWRRYLRKIDIQKSATDQYPVLVFSTETIRGMFHGPEKLQKQYYGKIGDRFDLIRIENADGQAFRNDYVYDHFRSGPPAPEQTAQEWEADLLSSDRFKILRALSWLGSIHREIDMKEMGGELEPVDSVKRVKEVLALPTVTAKIDEQKKSKDPWISQAANFASHPSNRR
ncbi:hypothetical protein BH10PLA2_BH10PLA2_09710 [soil metagenome]